MTDAINPASHHMSTVTLDKVEASTKLKFGLNFSPAARVYLQSKIIINGRC